MATIIYPNIKTINVLECESIEKTDSGRVIIAKGNVYEGIPAIW